MTVTIITENVMAQRRAGEICQSVTGSTALTPSTLRHNGTQMGSRLIQGVDGATKLAERAEDLQRRRMAVPLDELTHAGGCTDHRRSTSRTYTFCATMEFAEILSA